MVDAMRKLAIRKANKFEYSLLLVWFNVCIVTVRSCLLLYQRKNRKKEAFCKAKTKEKKKNLAHKMSSTNSTQEK